MTDQSQQHHIEAIGYETGVNVGEIGRAAVEILVGQDGRAGDHRGVGAGDSPPSERPPKLPLLD